MHEASTNGYVYLLDMEKTRLNKYLYQFQLKEELRRRAQLLLCKYVTGEPPYNPYLIAEKLGVIVQEAELLGHDGCVEVVDGQYIATISSRARSTRQRFTLAHELGHVLLMRQAQDGKPVNLKRYRSKHAPVGLHQDSFEETLCNCFAGELLMPLSEVRGLLSERTVEPQTIWRLAEKFNVSTQVAAGQIVRALGVKRYACSLWSLDALWPLPLWWTGLESSYRADQAYLESLIQERTELTQLCESYGNKKLSVIIKITPTPELRYAMLLIMPSRC